MSIVAEEVVPKVFLVGFAIQQVLQVLDPFIAVWARWRAPKSILSEADIKKTIMALCAFGLGLIAVLVSKDLRLLQLAKLDDARDHSKLVDIGISALVLGTGTEAVNTVLKYLGYVKDWQKATTQKKQKSAA